jgi:hypothetical protein
MNSRFEKVDKTINNLRGEMNSRFEKIENSMNSRMDRLDNRLWWIFGAIVFSILLPAVMKYL